MRLVHNLANIIRPVSYSDCPGWYQDDQALAFSAFRRSADYAEHNSYNSGSLGISFEALRPTFAAARLFTNPDIAQARAFFEEHFVPCLIDAEGFVTAFYEPEIEASRSFDKQFTVPFLRKPDDLVKVTDENRPLGLDASYAFGRQTPDGVVEYDDRRTIEQGSLNDRGLELAYVADRVDAFFAHVQGAARLKLTDGSFMRITYAAKTGHPFTGIGRILVARGEISAESISMQTIRQWLKDHPEKADDLIWQNRSYIFFRETAFDSNDKHDPNLGQIAAAKVPLTAGRSIAVDRLLHTFGTPIFVDAPGVTEFDHAPFSRLMIAQDTGTAIVGPARGDLFAGSGDAAGEIAGGIKSKAVFYALVPRALVEN
ncbi:murein transglycosylase A [Ochrobactrum sp. Marseille-Q0166]|uniref:murein transglycosylase A n=1 Tax=Ochrobactrum sp. Marseille-Q0166 TaxID=2761105 RepID=UPI0016556A39|nr:murein transglycosylase A [Ochrobactrum sp. Marseille-Q0166]MBC8716356.1 murein transglycosylase A [Ochrobactrum sp. Marseille-Q0166]